MGRPLHVPQRDVVEGTSDALSGTEITLHNEDSTNPHTKSGAQKGQSGYGLLCSSACLRGVVSSRRGLAGHLPAAAIQIT